MNSFTVPSFAGTSAWLEVTLKRSNYDGKHSKKRPMMIIFPGGGYYFCSEREAEPISLAYLKAGFDTCIMRYTVRTSPEQPALGDLPLTEAVAAVKYVREHAEEWEIDENRITVIGFSAGGHLAASLGVHWNDTERIPTAGPMAKPNGLILSYPVITAGELAHRGSIQNLTGIDSLSAEDGRYDTSAFVSKDTPPAFIWHTFEDGTVPVENSLAMASAMRRAGVPCALHIFTKGVHGLSLATDEVGGGPDGVSKWVELPLDWLKNMGLD